MMNAKTNLAVLTVVSNIVVSTTEIFRSMGGERVEGDSDNIAEDNSVLCRNCGMEVADPSYLKVSPLSPFFLERQNVSMFGSSLSIPVETLRNPAGFEFRVISFSTGGCQGVGDWTEEASWYPGYLWRVCVCPQCGAHLGWMFEPEDTADR